MQYVFSYRFFRAFVSLAGMSLFLSSLSFAQGSDTSDAVAADADEISMDQLVNANTSYPDGIRIYDRFNTRIGGDSVRYLNGRACNGWVEDRHPNGNLKHKGYYDNGQLNTLYFNYYESGQLEREFRIKDDFRCNMTSYYSNGVVRSRVSYKDGEPLEWEDYYPNGKLEFQEVYHKSFEYHIVNKYFFENGLPQSEMVLVDKKSKVFDKREFYKDGRVKTEGKVRFHPATLDYVKVGDWKEYNEAGKLVLEQSFDNDGQLKKSESH